jgi:ubiquinone/menaquinone biosynthesis C-methylase UbiE
MVATHEIQNSDFPMSDFHFRGMSFFFRIRDFFIPRERVLEEIAIEPGFKILDYGCGPGGYTVPAAEMVGAEGKIYALDMHPLAAETIRKKAERKGLKNIETITSDCKTGLEDESIDIVFLFDVFHNLITPQDILNELSRVMKPTGILAVSDHHLSNDEIVKEITKTGLFAFKDRGRRTFRFVRRKK